MRLCSPTLTHALLVFARACVCLASDVDATVRALSTSTADAAVRLVAILRQDTMSPSLIARACTGILAACSLTAKSAHAATHGMYTSEVLSEAGCVDALVSIMQRHAHDDADSSSDCYITVVQALHALSKDRGIARANAARIRTAVSRDSFQLLCEHIAAQKHSVVHTVALLNLTRALVVGAIAPESVASIVATVSSVAEHHCYVDNPDAVLACVSVFNDLSSAIPEGARGQ